MGGMIAQAHLAGFLLPDDRPKTAQTAREVLGKYNGALARSARDGMPYLIDGHNLIGRMPGMSLQDPNDEAALLIRLSAFCSREATTATVYFDGAVLSAMKEPPAAASRLATLLLPIRQLGHPSPPRAYWPGGPELGGGHIRRRRRRGCQAMPGPAESSEAFARRLAGAGRRHAATEKPDGPSDPAEIARWEAAFQSASRRRQRP